MDQAASTSTAEAVQEWTQRQLEAFIEDLRTAVHAETPSNEKALLDAGLTTIRDNVIARLGEPHSETRHASAEFGDVLDMFWTGRDAEGNSVADPNQAVLVVCHYDTVWPAGTVQTWPLSIDGDKLTGPGVLDMKFGIVQTAWAVAGLRELHLPYAPLRLLLTGDEEIGSVFARPHIESAARNAAITLVTEPSAGGSPKDRRKGMVFADLEVSGVQAHAGLEPQNGASAVHALASLIDDVVALAAPERGTTVNVGTFTGGTARNVVAGAAHAQVDIRITEPDEQHRVAAALQKLRLPKPYRDDQRLTLTVKVDVNRPPMNPTPASEHAMEKLLSVAQQQGRQLVPVAVGGASDANFVSGLGLPVIDGLGAVGEGPHAVHEHILLSGIAPQTGLLAGFLAAQMH